MTVSELVLVRHAESIWNAEDRWQGQTDVPLSARGRGEARAVGERLRQMPLDAIVCSDLSRARETADAIIAARGRAEPVQLHAGLREMDLGSWCGLPHAEVASRFADELRALQRGDDVAIGGHGESLPRFEDRVHAALAQVLSVSAGPRLEAGGRDTRVLVVTHGGCIRAVLMRLLGLRGRVRPLEGAANTSLTTLRIESGAVRALRSYNDATHLETGRESDAAGRVEITGAEARARLCALWDVEADERLVVPDDASVSLFDEPARRLVRYAVPRR